MKNSELRSWRQSLGRKWPENWNIRSAPEPKLKVRGCSSSKSLPGGRHQFSTSQRFRGSDDVSRHFDNVTTGFHLREYTFCGLLSLVGIAGFIRRNTLPRFLGLYRYNCASDNVARRGLDKPNALHHSSQHGECTRKEWPAGQTRGSHQMLTTSADRN